MPRGDTGAGTNPNLSHQLEFAKSLALDQTPIDESILRVGGVPIDSCGFGAAFEHPRTVCMELPKKKLLGTRASLLVARATAFATRNTTDLKVAIEQVSKTLTDFARPQMVVKARLPWSPCFSTLGVRFREIQRTLLGAKGIATSSPWPYY